MDHSSYSSTPSPPADVLFSSTCSFDTPLPPFSQNKKIEKHTSNSLKSDEKDSDCSSSSYLSNEVPDWSFFSMGNRNSSLVQNCQGKNNSGSSVYIENLAMVNFDHSSLHSFTDCSQISNIHPGDKKECIIQSNFDALQHEAKYLRIKEKSHKRKMKKYKHYVANLESKINLISRRGKNERKHFQSVIGRTNVRRKKHSPRQEIDDSISNPAITSTKGELSVLLKNENSSTNSKCASYNHNIKKLEKRIQSLKEMLRRERNFYRKKISMLESKYVKHIDQHYFAESNCLGKYNNLEDLCDKDTYTTKKPLHHQGNHHFNTTGPLGSHKKIEKNVPINVEEGKSKPISIILAAKVHEVLSPFLCEKSLQKLYDSQKHRYLSDVSLLSLFTDILALEKKSIQNAFFDERKQSIINQNALNNQQNKENKDMFEKKTCEIREIELNAIGLQNQVDLLSSENDRLRFQLCSIESSSRLKKYANLGNKISVLEKTVLSREKELRRIVECNVIESKRLQIIHQKELEEKNNQIGVFRDKVHELMSGVHKLAIKKGVKLENKSK